MAFKSVLMEDPELAEAAVFLSRVQDFLDGQSRCNRGWEKAKDSYHPIFVSICYVWAHGLSVIDGPSLKPKNPLWELAGAGIFAENLNNKIVFVCVQLQPWRTSNNILLVPQTPWSCRTPSQPWRSSLSSWTRLVKPKWPERNQQEGRTCAYLKDYKDHKCFWLNLPCK